MIKGVKDGERVMEGGFAAKKKLNDRCVGHSV